MGTMCSGTDAPILVLGALKKAMLDVRPDMSWDFSHEFSAEKDKRKQRFLQEMMPGMKCLFRDCTQLVHSTAETVDGSATAVPSWTQLFMSPLVLRASLATSIVTSFGQVRLQLGVCISVGLDSINLARDCEVTPRRWWTAERTCERSRHAMPTLSMYCLASVLPFAAILRSVDILFVGFPCQDVSLLNFKARASREAVLAGGLRTGTVFSSIVEFARQRRPKLIVLENVLGLGARGKQGVSPLDWAVRAPAARCTHSRMLHPNA